MSNGGGGLQFTDLHNARAEHIIDGLRGLARIIRTGRPDNPGVEDGIACVADELDKLSARLALLDQDEMLFDVNSDAVAQRNDALRGMAA